MKNKSRLKTTSIESILNLNLNRGMRQKRYESVEKMLDLLDICKRIGPKFPLDAMFLDPHDRKCDLKNNRNNIAEWDDDMTYLYVDYPYYKKYLIFASISAVRIYIKNN